MDCSWASLPVPNVLYIDSGRGRDDNDVDDSHDNGGRRDDSYKRYKRHRPMARRRLGMAPVSVT